MAFFDRHPDRQFTAEELNEIFSFHPKDGKPIAKSTLYRQLCALCDQGVLQRFDGTDPKTGAAVRYYQLVGKTGDCLNHFHLKCVKCGEVQHLECDRTAHLLSHLLEMHHFVVDCGKSILFGVCDRCAKEEDASCKTSREALCPCGCGKPRHRKPNHALTTTQQPSEEDFYAAHS
jgi:Fur family ferric uptake transcriptional regulator